MNHHVILTEEEQFMAVNALSFFHEFFKYNGCDYRTEVVEEWRDVADDTNLDAADALATKIANSD